MDQALKGLTASYTIEIQDNLDPMNHFTKTKEVVESHLKDLLKTMKGFKFNIALEVTFEKNTFDSKTGKCEFIHKKAYFNSKPKTITNANKIESEPYVSQQEILGIIEVWISEGSGWTIDRVDNNYINVVNYKPLNGSSYIELPTELKNSAKGLINIKNKGDECFRWRHIRHLNSQSKDPQRIKKTDKQYIDNLDYSNIIFPVSQKQYNKIEKQNSIRINVFGYEEEQPFPVHISKEKFEDQMNVLLITKDEKRHYVLIKDFNKFMYNQSKHRERKHFCMYCLQCFSSESILAKHTNNCLTISGKKAIKMPKTGDNILNFNNFHKQLPVPFIIYANFKAIMKKMQGCRPNNDKLYNEAYQTDEDSGYRYKVVYCYKDKYTKPIQTYWG